MNPIADILSTYPFVILDGALATELERRGCDLRDPLWSARVLIENPALIAQVHFDYFRAGADCATTASYQASVEGFMRRGLGEGDAIDLIRSSVSIARNARDEFWSDEENRAGRPRPFIAASVGPYGAFLADGSEFRGEYGLSEQQLVAFHRPRMRALVDGRPELLAFETIPCFVEARALVSLLREWPDCGAWVSFSACDGEHLRNGEPFSECVAWLDRFPQIAAIGVNCTSPEHVPSLIRIARAATAKPILVYPNSGERWDSATRGWSGGRTCGPFGDAARAWHRDGARLIGGCCRTTPDDIRSIAAWARAQP